MGNVTSLTSPWVSNGTVTSVEARLALAASWAKSASSSINAETGVVEGANPTASISGNNVNVTAHQVIVQATGGTYVGTSATTLACGLDTPLPSSGTSRIDLIVAEIVDPSDSATYRLRSVTGTAAASPSVPAVPANTTPLFRVPVANAGPGTPVPIYSWTRAPGGIRLVETGDTRAGGFTGDLRKFRTGQIDVWNGSSWQTIVAPAAWSQFTPTLTSAAGGQLNLGSTGSAIGRYLIAGKVMHMRYVFRTSGAGIYAGKGQITTQLPPGVTSAPSEETQIFAKINAVGFVNGGILHGIFLGKCFIPPNSQIVTLWFPYSKTQNDLGAYQATNNNGEFGNGIPIIPGDVTLPNPMVIQGTIEIQ